ncbi:hypothetical protein [Actinomadura luteofluorescens]|uniref:restriction endonuclease subunit S n=1 Tax=Actinomadura luteofluorescens TaxID=46163 RepID=UPI0030CD82C4
MSEHVRFSDLVKINPRTILSGKIVPFIGMEDVSEDGAILNIRERSASELSSGLSSFRDDDVLFAKITPCMENGKGAYVAGVGAKGALGSTEFHVLRARRDVEPRYIYHWTRTRTLRRAAEAMMTGSAGQRRVPTQFFHRFLVPGFPLREQRRIADILDALDARIHVEMRELAKRRLLREGAVRRAMEPGLKMVDSVDASRLGEIDGSNQGGWTPLRLGSLLTRIEAGVSPDLDDRPAGTGEWGVLKVSAVGQDGFRSMENKVVVDRSLHQANLCVTAGDLIMTRANTSDLVGLSCVVPEVAPGLMLSDKTLRLVVDSRKVTVSFVDLALGMPEVRKQIQVAATGTSASMKNISQSAICALMIPFSDSSSMGRICDINAKMKNLLEKQQVAVAALRDLKRGLAEDLLTGRVRV